MYVYMRISLYQARKIDSGKVYALKVLDKDDVLLGNQVCPINWCMRP